MSLLILEHEIYVLSYSAYGYNYVIFPYASLIYSLGRSRMVIISQVVGDRGITALAAVNLIIE